jgi:beta-glucuronidase
VGWCGLNECNQDIVDKITQLDDVQRAMFLAAKALDPTRPVLDTSGYSHRIAESDAYDCHNYEQDLAKFRKTRGGLAQALKADGRSGWSIPYRGQPFMNSEFGGIWWNPADAKNSAAWGYGKRPRTIEEFYKRFAGLCGTLLADPDIFGYCYTQLTDVFQEVNGLFTFDRLPKFDLARLRMIQSRPAAAETARLKPRKTRSSRRTQSK